MRKHLLFILLFTSLLSCMGQGVSGICVDGDRMYYLTGRKVHCIGIKNNILLAEKDIGRDTLIPYKLFTKAVYLYGIVGDTAISEFKNQVRFFKLINVISHNHFVYVSVMFQQKNKNSRYRYAVLQFDSLLTFRNYFIVKDEDPRGPNTYPPYHANEFDDMGDLLLVNFHSHDSAFLSHGGYAFRKDKNELRMFYISSQPFSMPMMTHVMSQPYSIMSPTVYPVINSGSTWFYQFPHPLVYNVRNKNIIDPYQLKHKVDSINKDSKNGVKVYNLSINFKQAQIDHKRVVLATSQINELIYMVVSNIDTSKIDIVKCDPGTKESKILTMDIPSTDNYFVFDKSKLYYLKGSIIMQTGEILLDKIKF